MTEENTTLASSLEEKHLISILMLLGMNGPSRKIDIYKAISTNPRMPGKLDKLESMGLVTQIFDEDQRSTVVTLTPQGTEISQLLSRIESTLRSIQ